jgi:hypothetical protein
MSETARRLGQIQDISPIVYLARGNKAGLDCAFELRTKTFIGVENDLILWLIEIPRLSFSEISGPKEIDDKISVI